MLHANNDSGVDQPQQLGPLVGGHRRKFSQDGQILEPIAVCSLSLAVFIRSVHEATLADECYLRIAPTKRLGELQRSAPPVNLPAASELRQETRPPVSNGRSMARRTTLAGGTASVAALALVAGLGATPTRAAATGSFPLPDGRALHPAGRMVAAGDFPAGEVLAGSTAYVADNGRGTGDLLGVDTRTLTVTKSLPGIAVPPSTNGKPTANSGQPALSHDRSTVYLAGAATSTITSFPVSGTPVTGPTRTVTVDGQPDIWGIAGLADGNVIVAQTFGRLGPSSDEGNTVLKVDPATGHVVGPAVTVGREPFTVTDATVVVGQAQEEVVLVADRESGDVAVVDPGVAGGAAHLRHTIPVGRQPSSFAVTPDGRDILVSLALDDEVVDLDPATWTVRSRTTIGSGNGVGSSPTSIAIDPSGRVAYVALSADNAIGVLHRHGQRWVTAGQIPTAAYPTAVALDVGTRQLIVTAAKGVGLPAGTPAGTPVPASGNRADPTGVDAGGSGTIEAIPVPDSGMLARYTTSVRAANMPARPARRVPGQLAGITHVVYVIRENKTYDEELGDLGPSRWGVPDNTLYPEAVTPNIHALATRLGALLENFYADEDVSDTGHAAVMGAVANDWLERVTPQAYNLGGAPRQGPELGNDDRTNWSPADFLLDDALAQGIDFRDYGEFYRHSQTDDSLAVSPALQAHIVPKSRFRYPGFDPGHPDTARVADWLADFRRDSAPGGVFPQLEVLYLPEDHTTMDAPTPSRPVPPTPQQEVADSDLATGQLVDALSKSPYWDSTAVFLTEDDPQSGVDHVDAHRTVGLVAGGRVLRTDTRVHYDSTSMLRTIEEILGLRPMTEFDATAVPMDALFVSARDPRREPAYDALTPSVPVLPPALAAAARARAAAALGPVPDLAHVVPSVQRDLQWFAVRGVPAPTVTYGTSPPAGEPGAGVER